jgi:hypothetical protein
MARLATISHRVSVSRAEIVLARVSTEGISLRVGNIFLNQ